MEREKIVTLMVNECSEFHSLGESHENIKTVDEAIKIWKKIPAERMHGVKSIGIRVADAKDPDEYEEMDVLVGKFIDRDMIHYFPEIAENKKAMELVEELIKKLPDVEVLGGPEVKQNVKASHNHR